MPALQTTPRARRVPWEARTSVDPWVNTLASVLGDLQGNLLTEDAWAIVGVVDEAGRRQWHNCCRLGNAMKTLGFKNKPARFGGELKRCYARGSKDEQAQRIYVMQEPAGWFAVVRQATQ